MDNGRERNQNTNYMSHDEVLEALPSYVLGILEPEEMLAVDDYVQSHPELQTRINALQETAAHLAYTAPPASLPENVTDRLVTRARADLIHSATVTEHTTSRRSALPLGGQTITRPSTINRVPEQQYSNLNERRWFDHLGEWFLHSIGWKIPTFGAATVMVVLAIATIQLLNSVLTLRTQLDSATTHIEKLESQNSERQQIVNSVLIDPEYVARLEGENLAGSFYASQDTGFIVLNGLPPLAEDQIYQLWLISGSESPVPSWLLEAPDNGVLKRIDTLPLRADQFTQVAVSIEPVGGSIVPSEDIIAVGSRI